MSGKDEDDVGEDDAGEDVQCVIVIMLSISSHEREHHIFLSKKCQFSSLNSGSRLMCFSTLLYRSMI